MVMTNAFSHSVHMEVQSTNIHCLICYVKVADALVNIHKHCGIITTL